MHLVTQNSITNNDKICKKKGFCQTKKNSNESGALF
jgi:hypothetical protein